MSLALKLERELALYMYEPEVLEEFKRLLVSLDSEGGLGLSI